MQVLQTTLLTGPYDWDQAILPREEFAGRLARVRSALAASGANALLVHGYAGDYGALNYLTGFVPKLGPALALVPLEGDIRLLVSGTELMMPWAQRLTWVEDLCPFANVPKVVAEWLGQPSQCIVATWGTDTMAHGIVRGVTAAVGPLVPLDAALDPLRQHKSPRELALVRHASEILAAAAIAFEGAVRRGVGARTAALSAERTAIAVGAQDARTLVSLRPGGAPLPLDGAEDRVLDPILAAIAVQYSGYWAAGYVTVSAQAGPALGHAQEALAALIAMVTPGVSGAALDRAAAAALAPFGLHPALKGSVCGSIGLSIEEGMVAGDAALEPGGTYALRVGAVGEGADAALVSAMIAVNDTGATVLWPAPRA